MQTPEAKILLKSMKKEDPSIFNIQYSQLKDVVSLASGNFGDVYCGFYKKRKVAVKHLLDVDDEKMHKYLRREISTLKSLQHSNIVEFIGVCKHKSGLYVVTEFVESGDLRSLLKKKSIELSWEKRVFFALQVARAFEYLHSKGFVHRDLKSHNILVTSQSIAKVCDFGFSRKVGQEKDKKLSLCGTDEWMAPEVLLDLEYDESVDVFSFGMLCTELIRRKKPPVRYAHREFAFEMETFKENLPDDAPRILLQVVGKCAASTPSARPSFSQLVPRLEELYASLQASAENKGTKEIDISKLHGKGRTVELRVLKSYESKDSVELSVAKGDTIRLIQADDSGWCFGEAIETQKRGWFPRNIAIGYHDTESSSEGGAAIDDDSLTTVEKRCSTNKELLNFLAQRPSPEDLERKNILYSSPATGGGNEKFIKNQKKLEKKKKVDLLSTLLRRRGGASSKKKSPRPKTQSEGVALTEVKLDSIISGMALGIEGGSSAVKSALYKHQFLGSDGISWLLTNEHASSASQAVELMQLLMRRRALLSLEADDVFKEKNAYRMAVSKKEPAGLMNVAKTYEGTSSPALALITELLEDIIEKTRKAAELSREDLIACSLAATRLQVTRLESLTEVQLRVFYLNLYNYMMAFIVAKFGEPTTVFCLQDYHDRLVFVVGGNTFTPSDVKYHALLNVSSFPDSDERKATAVVKGRLLDLFGLSDHTPHSPRIHVFFEDTLDYGLQTLLGDFLHRTVIIEEDKNSLRVPASVAEYKELRKVSYAVVFEELAPYLKPNVLELIETALEVGQLEEIRVEVEALEDQVVMKRGVSFA